MMDSIEKISRLSKDLLPDLILLRRKLHQYPELSFKEFETSKRIAKELEQIGIPYYSGLNKTGIIGIIEGDKPGLTIGIRAELDALPISEESGVEYSSQNPNVMHACGHDIHMANLIGVAMILWQLRETFSGKVLLIFQPGEELLPGGAKGIMESEIFLKNKPDIMLGLHILPELPIGKVGFRTGAYMASGDEVYITVKGKGGHAALPQTLIDPVLIASHIIVGLQQVVSRKNPSAIPTVLSFGKVIANGANNIIPNEVSIEGTFRTMDEAWRTQAHTHINRIAEGIAASMEGSCTIEIRRGYPSIINNTFLTNFVSACAKDYVGIDNVVDLPLRMTTDDFAYYAAAIPSVYFRIGSGSDNIQTSSLHSRNLIVNDQLLESSVGLTSWLVLQSLKNSNLLNHLKEY
jgi:amidohydrolase